MRFLRNPFVSGVLAAAAVVLIFFRLVLPHLHVGPTGAPLTITQILAPIRGPVAPTNRTEVSLDSSNIRPERGIDRNYLEGRFAKWVASPQRDPFLLLGGDVPGKVKEEVEFPSPITKWKLSGIWSQTGSSLAVINNTVHQVGDEIEGYKIIRIEGEEVWFQGPKRKERLGMSQRGRVVFRDPVFMPATNQPPASAVPE